MRLEIHSLLTLFCSKAKESAGGRWRTIVLTRPLTPVLVGDKGTEEGGSATSTARGGTASASSPVARLVGTLDIYFPMRSAV